MSSCGRRRDRCRQDMASSPCSSSHSSTGVEDNNCIRFLELRKTLSHLRALIHETTCGTGSRENHREKNVYSDTFKEEIEKVTEALDRQFENFCCEMNKNSTNVVEGQRCIDDGVRRVEHMVRQMSQADVHRAELERQIRDLNTRLREEQSSKVHLQVELQTKQQEIFELKKLLHEAETRAITISKDLKNEQTIQQLQDSVANLSQQITACTNPFTGTPGGFGPRYRQRMTSKSCQELDTVDHDLNMSGESCFTLNDLDLSNESNEFTGHDCGQGLARQRAFTRSTTTIDTKDTGFSDLSNDTFETIRMMNQKINQLLESAAKCPQPTTSCSELPVFIRGFCVNIQESIFSSDRSRINQFSRSLGIDRDRLRSLRDQLDYNIDLPSLFWAVIYEWNSICETKGNQATMLNQLIQACDDCRIPNPLDVKPMPTKDRLIVEQNYSYLVEHLMVQPTLVYLRNCQFLTSSIVSYVLEPSPEPEKILRLVDILPVCGHTALDIFVEALRRSEQTHVADRIVQSNPLRFKEGRERNDLQHSWDAGYTVFPRQDLQTKKKKRFSWKKPFRIMFKSKSYKFAQ